MKDLKDLKHKKVGLQDVESTSGYIYPLASLKDKGVSLNDIHTKQIKGYDQALIALLNNDVDAVATYQDARADLKKIILKYIKILKSFTIVTKFRMILFQLEVT